MRFVLARSDLPLAYDWLIQGVGPILQQRHPIRNHPRASNSLGLLGLVLICFFQLPQAHGQNTANPTGPLRIASPPLSPSVYIGRRLLQEIYTEAGLTVQFVELPLARSIHAAEAGLVDGELGRTPAVVKKTSSLMPLGTPLSMGIVSVRRRS